jgi:hypothetical protein
MTVKLPFEALLRLIPGDPVLRMRLSISQTLVQEFLLPPEELGARVFGETGHHS